jgi:hypothetical protein
MKMTKINKFVPRVNGTLSIKDFIKREKPPEPAPVTNYMHGYDHLPEDIQQLVRIHTFKRPHGSKTVDYFVEQFLTEPHVNTGVHMRTLYSKTGEPLAVVITTDVTSRTMFSAHVDTVHRTAGRQSVEYDHDLGIMMKTQDVAKTDNECLGADDGAGIWVLLQMIKADVPGTYVFHYGEEVGGIGSSAIAIDHKVWLAQFDRAIAIDRKGTDNVITHQGWGRCCSDEFAKALSAQINMAGQNHSFKPDNGGVFTDTANYTDDIPECTNLSCGYDAQHTRNENLDVEFLIRLKDALILVDWESLPTVRKAGEVDDLYGDYGSYGGWMSGKYGKYSKETITPEETDSSAMLKRLGVMSTAGIKKWALKAPIADIAAVLTAAVDKIYELEDEVDNLQGDLDYDQTLEDDANNADVGELDFDSDGNFVKGIDKW